MSFLVPEGVKNWWYGSKPVPSDPTAEIDGVPKGKLAGAKETAKVIFPITNKFLEKTWPEQGGFLKTAAKIAISIACIITGAVDLLVDIPRGLWHGGKKVCSGVASGASYLHSKMPEIPLLHRKTD